jgi:hypothetical protein
MNENKKIIKAVFDSPGFSSDLHLTHEELTLFRSCIEDQYLDVLLQLEKSSGDKLTERGIENYHQISHLIDHSLVWNKKNRCLPKNNVAKIKKANFMGKLKDIFGNFKISNIVYDQTLVRDSEEIYWRLVRPEAESDVGAIHADKWFHEALSTQYIPQETTSLKVWIPIYCEPGKNGLLIVPDSNKREWEHVFTSNSLGHQKPVIAESHSPILINTPPGNMIIFSDRTLHGGAPNRGLKTRVSAEITLLLESSHSHY